MRLSIALFALALLACSCPERDGYTRQLQADRQLLLPRPPTTPNDHYHVGVHLKLEALQRALDRLAQDDILALTHTITIPLAGRSVPIDLVARIHSFGITASDACDACLTFTPQLQLAIEPRVPAMLLRAAGLQSRYAYDTSMTLDSSLDLRVSSSGHTAVILDLSDAADATFDSVLGALPNTLVTPLRPHLNAYAKRITRSLLSELELLELEPLEIGGTGLELAFARLRTDATQQTIFIGIMLNLDGATSPAVTQPMDPSSKADLRVAFAPELATVLSRALTAQPTQLIDAAVPDAAHEDEPTKGLTVNSIEMRADSMHARFRFWRFETPCLWADLAAEAEITRDAEGRFRLQVGQVTLEEASGYASFVESALDRQERFARKLARQSEALLNTRFVELTDDYRLHFTPTAFLIREDGFAVESTLVLDR